LCVLREAFGCCDWMLGVWSSARRNWVSW
jgi:hypothetical protein